MFSESRDDGHERDEQCDDHPDHCRCSRRRRPRPDERHRRDDEGGAPYDERRRRDTVAIRGPRCRHEQQCREIAEEGGSTPPTSTSARPFHRRDRLQGLRRRKRHRTDGVRHSDNPQKECGRQWRVFWTVAARPAEWYPQFRAARSLRRLRGGVPSGHAGSSWAPPDLRESPPRPASRSRRAPARDRRRVSHETRVTVAAGGCRWCPGPGSTFATCAPFPSDVAGPGVVSASRAPLPPSVARGRRSVRFRRPRRRAPAPPARGGSPSARSPATRTAAPRPPSRAATAAARPRPPRPRSPAASRAARRTSPR